MKRIVLGNFVFYGRDYSRMFKQNNSFLKCGKSNFGKFQYFLSFSFDSIRYIVAMCSVIQVKQQHDRKCPNMYSPVSNCRGV